jgi:dTDP-4-dehydrorhamnose 3,5-epimerase
MIESRMSQYHEDDRAQRLLNIFDIEHGQINVSYVNSTNHVVAWHVHKIQTDYWACLKGSFKVGLAVPKDDGTYEVRWEYLSDKNPKTLQIPPGVYHGYKALEPKSIILYFLTEKWDLNDEWKVNPGYFGELWETESK